MAPTRLPGGRHGLSPARVADHQRHRVMDALIEASVREGIEALTVDRIVRGAAISRKTFYDHFANREAAIEATYRLVCEQLTGAVGDAARQRPEDPVGAGLAAILALATQRPDIARFCFAEAPRAGAGVLDIREALVDELIEWLRAAHGEGDVRLRAAVGGLLEAMAAGPGDGAQLRGFLADVVDGSRRAA